MKYEYDLATHSMKWLTDTFGEEVAYSPKERALRLLEEATEFAQANGITAARASAIVDHVYDKPPSDPKEELADVMFCVLVAAGAGHGGIGGPWNLPELVFRKLQEVRAAQRIIRGKWRIKCEKGLTAFPDVDKIKDYPKT